MVTWALVWNGTVENIGGWDGEAKPAPADAYMVELPEDSNVQVGWIYDGESFYAPDEVP